MSKHLDFHLRLIVYTVGASQLRCKAESAPRNSFPERWQYFLMNATAAPLWLVLLCACALVRARAVQCISSGTVKTWLSNLEKVIHPPHTHMPTVLSVPLSAGESHKLRRLNAIICFILRWLFKFTFLTETHLCGSESVLAAPHVFSGVLEGSDLVLALRLKIFSRVGSDYVRGWGINDVSEGPHKHRITSTCVVIRGSEHWRSVSCHLRYTSPSPLITSELFKKQQRVKHESDPAVQSVKNPNALSSEFCIFETNEQNLQIDQAANWFPG